MVRHLQANSCLSKLDFVFQILPSTSTQVHKWEVIFFVAFLCIPTVRCISRAVQLWRTEISIVRIMENWLLLVIKQSQFFFIFFFGGGWGAPRGAHSWWVNHAIPDPRSGKHMAVLWKFRLEAGLHLGIKFTTTLWSWVIILARRAG